MLVGLNDKLIIGCTKTHIEDKRPVLWVSHLRPTVSTDFVFFLFHRADDPTDVGFVAVEERELAKFVNQCKIVRESQCDLEEPKNKSTINDQFRCQDNINYEFTVTNQFQYGQNNKKTSRFLVFKNPLCKPNQHRFISAFAQTKAADTLGNPYKELLLSSFNFHSMEDIMKSMKEGAMKSIMEGLKEGNQQLLSF